MIFTVTPAAEKFIRRMMRFGGSPNAGFRLVVSPGGCSGLSSEFTVEETAPDGDGAFDVQGMKFFLPAESRMLLDGVTIDFADTPTKTGFVITDPKSKGCGSCSTATPAGADSLDMSH